MDDVERHETPRPALRRLPSGFWVAMDTGDAVAHRVLENLPFARTIESWVRECFPDAHYEALDTTSMTPLDLRDAGVVALQGPKGLGKSKAIRAAIAALPAHTTAVQITFRRSLAWSSAELLGAAASVYSALPAGSISARQHPRLTIVVNSVARIRGCYDVVVIDEIVSVLDMLAGTLLAPGVRGQIVNTLQWLIAAARTVVLADAMLDAPCVEFVMRCRRSTALRVIDYTRRLHTDYTYVAHALLSTWQRELTHALFSGQRVVVPCMTKAMAEHIAAKFAASAVPTLLYTADSHGARLSEHMAAIDAHWSTVQLLVFSPVITAGCSFERRHFDVAFFYGAAGMGSVRSAVQMIARVRDLRTRTVHVFLARADATYAPLPSYAVVNADADASALTSASAFSSAPDDHTRTHLALLRLLDHSRARETLICERAFAFYFWSLVAHSGPRITFLRADLASAATAVAGDVAATAPGAAAPAPLIPFEPPFVHDWDNAFLAPFATHDAARAALAAAFAVAAPSQSANATPRPTLLQQATILAPLAQLVMYDAYADADGVCCAAWRKFSTSSDDAALLAALPPGRAPETRARVKAWLALLVLKSLTPSPAVCECVPPLSVPWLATTAAQSVAAVMDAVVARRATSTTRFAPVLAAPALVPPRAVQRYMAADTTALDVVLDAWALTARRDGDSDERLPHGLLPLLLQRIENAQRAVMAVHGAAHAMTNVPVGRSASGVGTLDVVVITATRQVHFFALRQGITRQRATADVAVDVAKLRALCAAANVRPPYTAAAVHVVYADAVIEAPCALSTATLRAKMLAPEIQTRTTEELLLEHAVFAVVRPTCADADASSLLEVQLFSHRCGLGAAVVYTDVAAAAVLREQCARAPLFCWGTRHFQLAPQPQMAMDVEVALCSLLGMAQGAVPLEDVHCHHNDVFIPETLAALPPEHCLRRLWQVSLAVLQFGFVVVVVEGRPVSVELRMVPPVALAK